MITQSFKNTFFFTLTILISSYYLIEYIFDIQLTYLIYFSLLITFLGFLFSLGKTNKNNFLWSILFILIFILVLVWELLMQHKNNIVTYSHQFSNVILYLFGFYFSIKAHKMNLDKFLNKNIFNITYLFSLLFIFSVPFIYTDLFSNRFGSLKDFNPNGIAYSASLTLIILNSVYSKNLKLLAKLILLLAQIILLVVIFFSGSRASMICVLLTLFLINFYISEKKFIYLGVLASLTALIFFQITNYFDLEIPQFQRFFRLFNFSVYGDLAIDSRLYHYVDLNNNWQDYFLFGKYNYEFYPHNIFLEMFFRYGFFFSLLLFIPFLISIRALYKLRIILKNKLFYMISSLFIFSLIYSLFSLDLNLNKMIWLSTGFLNGIYINRNFNYKI